MLTAASQIRTLSKAMDDMIKDHYGDLANPETAADGVFELSDVDGLDLEDKFKTYLPAGFNLEKSKLFDDYKFRVIRKVTGDDSQKHISLTGLVVAPALENNQGNSFNTRAAKIASMVGANGGVAKGDNIQGVQGIWNINASDPDFDLDLDDLPNNSVAATSIHAINSASGAGAENVLYRDNSKGDTKYNRMSTTLFLGNQDMKEVHRIIANAGTGGSGGELIIGASSEPEGDIDSSISAKMFVNGMANISQEFSVGNENPSDNNNFLFASQNLIQLKTGGKISTTSSNGNIDIGAVNGDILVTSGKNIGMDAKDQINMTVGNVENKGVNMNLGDDGYLRITSNKGHGKHNLDIYSPDNYRTNIEADTDLNIKSGSGISLNTENTIKLDATDGDIDLNAHNYIRLNAENKNVQITAGDVIDIRQEGTNQSHVTLDKDMVEMGSGDQKIQVDGTKRFVRFAGENNAKTKQGAVGVYNGQAFMKSGMDPDMWGGATIVLDGDEAEGNINMEANYGKISLETKNNDALMASLKLDNNGAIFAEADSFTFGASGAEELIYAYKTGDQGIVELQSTTGNGTSTVIQLSDDINLDARFSNINLLAQYTNLQAQYTNVQAQYTKFYNTSPAPEHDNSVIDSGIVINHQGMVTLPMASSVKLGESKETLASTKGKQDVVGYIKADRLLANRDYVVPFIHADDYSDFEPEKGGYDAYQVNPAYTSVMHDIKLTTRGGARLSDILPDFINKGIYVIDNTYQEPGTSEDKDRKSWETFKVYSTENVKYGDGGEISDCNGNYKCVTTPWLGFVPAPQCPPGYLKVIAINPIRWKMADVYSIAMEPTGDIDIYDHFNNYFIKDTNPKTARFVLDEADGSTGSHTHEVKQGMPVTFQTNTWLNTTISGVRKVDNDYGTSAGTGDFMGWHAIMGFLYHGAEYHDFITSVNKGVDLDGKIVWNIFPVYNEELAAVTNVYCYFERRTVKRGSETIWEWNSNLVDNSYDQIEQFRSGYGKPDNYKNRLNDPALGYKDPW